MNKPKYLTGEALTFLEWVGQHQVVPFDATQYQHDIGQSYLFYSQPFTKDMIVRPNRPKWNPIGLESPGVSSQELEWSNWQPLFEGEWKIKSLTGTKLPDIIKCEDKSFPWLIINTIDDFIRESKKAQIKLTWN